MNYNILYDIGEYSSSLDKYMNYLLAILKDEDLRFAIINWLQPKMNMEWNFHKQPVKSYDRPKGLRTPFIFFYRKTLDNIRKNFPDLSITEIGKKIGKEWKSLKDSEKDFYKELANDDKIRYRRELKDYEPPRYTKTGKLKRYY